MTGTDGVATIRGVILISAYLREDKPLLQFAVTVYIQTRQTQTRALAEGRGLLIVAPFLASYHPAAHFEGHE